MSGSETGATDGPRIPRGRRWAAARRLGRRLDAAKGGEVAELEGFAQGLSKDYEAVKAALTHEWSNARVEGQINRPKFIKRQMYGRANFELLKARFLARRLRRSSDRRRPLPSIHRDCARAREWGPVTATAPRYSNHERRVSSASSVIDGL